MTSFNISLSDRIFHHKEHKEWLSKLNFYQDEIKFFQNELLSVLHEHIDRMSIIELVDEYRDIFIKKLRQIDELRIYDYARPPQADPCRRRRAGGGGGTRRPARRRRPGARGRRRRRTDGRLGRRISSASPPTMTKRSCYTFRISLVISHWSLHQPPGLSPTLPAISPFVSSKNKNKYRPIKRRQWERPSRYRSVRKRQAGRTRAG